MSAICKPTNDIIIDILRIAPSMPTLLLKECSLIALITPKKLSIKQKWANFAKNKKDKFKSFYGIFSFVFPPLAKSKSIKDSVVELKKLNKDTKKLISTKIPYGEGKERYKELSDNIALACNIQTKLKKKIG